MVRGREVHESRAVCDVLLEDAAGVAGGLPRIEAILRPGEAVVREGAPAGVPS